MHGQRKEETREKETDYLRAERTFGRFYRSLTLPGAAVPEQAEATSRPETRSRETEEDQHSDTEAVNGPRSMKHAAR